MKLAKSQIFIIVINSILFLIGFVLMFSFSVHASSPSTVLPYYANTSQYSIDSATAEDIVNKIKADYPNVDYGDYYIIFCTSESVWQTWWDNVPSLAYSVYFFDYKGLETTWSSGTTFENFQFFDSNCYIEVNCNTVGTLVYQQLQEKGYITRVESGNYIRRFFGEGTVIDISNSFFTYSYQQYYPVYCNANFTTLHLGDGEGSIVSNSVPTVVGHATQPTNDPNNFINGSNGSPIGKPTFPTINYYTYTTYTPPTIDTSNVESLLESIYDLIEYNFNYQVTNFVGQYSNFLDNISNLTDYIVKSFENGFNKVIKSIQDVITDLYNNFVSLFEPIANSIAYISEPLDSDIILSGITDSNFYNGFEDTKDFFNDVDEIFDISEPDSFIIEIHLEDLNFFDSGLLDFNLPTVYLNLGANILPFRNALRVFLWCMVSVGTVFYIQKNLPSMLKGDETGGNSSAK